MILENTSDFIYKNCSDRISQRIRKKKLSHRSIYKQEPKMIGRICRCIVVPKRNPYLIQDSVRDELKEKLVFNSYQEMLWGSEEEIQDNLPALFMMIMSDLYKFKDAYMDFVLSHDSFKRWTCRFEEWIEESLMPLLKQYMPEDSSFSARILNMIESDFSKMPLLKITNDPDELEVLKSLLVSTDKYIVFRRNIQKIYIYKL